MSSVPDWLAPPKTELPDWLTVSPADRREAKREIRAFKLEQFEMVLPRVLEMVCEGYPYSRALREIPVEPPIDPGAFMHWLKKNPSNYALYKEAKEVRTEHYAGEIIKHALGEETQDDVSRSRLIVETYWKLMGSENRKEYGDTKTIEVTKNISITAALAQAEQRVIEAEVIEEFELMPSTAYRQIEAPADWDEDE